MNDPRLTLVIPTYNEEAIVAEALSAIADGIPPELRQSTELLIVDDGRDRLPEIVNAVAKNLPFFSVKVFRNSPGLGKGRSIALGFQKASGDVVGFMDVDLSTPPRYIQGAYESIARGEADIYIGSRWVEGAEVKRQQSWIKDVLGHVLGIVARNIIFFGMPHYLDTQCGFKFYRRELANFLYQSLSAPDGLADLEILLRANLLGLKVKEVGVQWTDLRESKRSLSRIFIGEVKSILAILVRYKLGARRERRQLQARFAGLSSGTHN